MWERHRRILSLVGALVVAASVAVVPTGPAQAAPAISLSPTSGPPGTTVTVTGSQFAPGFPPCEVRFGIDQSRPVSQWGGTTVATCTVNGNGLVSVTFVVPSVAPGSRVVGVCNYCTGGEFAEAATANFTVTSPPTTTTTTTTTTTPPTTTTTPPTTTTTTTTTLPPTTTSTTTTSTTTTTLPPDGLEEPEPVPISGDVPPIVFGAGIPDLGPNSPLIRDIGSLWQPISIVGGQLSLPDWWLQRCGPPPGAARADFDHLRLGGFASRLTPDGVDPQVFSTGGFETVVAPGHGTWTAPHAVGVDLEPSTSAAWDGLGRTFGTSDRSGFTYLGLRVGLGRDHTGPVVIELGARGAFGGRFVDVDRVELGPERAPATTCLMVVAPEGEPFTTAHLRAYSGDTARVPIIYDSVFWSQTDPYPIEVPNLAPVEIIWPPEGQRLVTGRTTAVLGRVRWPDGLTLPSVHVALPTWDGTGVVTREATLGRSSTEDFERTALFWLDAVRVPSGPFELHASVATPGLRGADLVDRTGVGPPAPPPDEYRDRMVGEVDVVPWAMEVTQAVRGPLEFQPPGSVVADDFNHVAGKRTVVRGYAVHRFDEGRLGIRPGRLEVDAVLHGTRDGVTLPFSPLVPDNSAVRLFAVEPGERAEQFARPSTANTWNFVLPSQWTVGGPIELRLEANPPTSPIHVPELDGTDGADNVIGRRVAFTDVGRVGVSVLNVELHWRCDEAMVADDRHPCAGRAEGDPVSSAIDEGTLRTTSRDWWRMWPAPGDFPAYLTFSDIALPHRNDDPRVTVPRTVEGRASVTGWESWRNAYWDLYCRDTPLFTTKLAPPTMRDLVWMTHPWWAPIPGGGCAWVGMRTAFRSNASPSTAAQEAGHTMGLRHTSDAHGERSGGSAVVRFPGDHAQLGTPEDPEWGFDTMTMTVINPGTGSGHVHDYMSYGGGVNWTSVATWDHVFRSFVNNRTYDETRGPVLGRVDDSGAPAGGPDSYVVEGVVAPDGTVAVGTPRIADGTAIPGSTGGEVTVVLRDGAGAPLAEREVPLQPLHTHGGDGSQGFVAVFPGDVDPRSLEVRIDGDLVEERVGGTGSLGTLKVVAGAGLGEVRWDADGLVAPYLVEATTDGEGWWPLGSVDDPVFQVPSDLPFAGEWSFRVQASDGVGVAAATAPVSLGTPLPRAVIAGPLAGARLPIGMHAVHAAVSTIGETDTTYTWLVDGDVVNEGAVAEVPILPGARTITLRVEAAGVVDEATVDVVGVVDTDGDGFDDEWERLHGFDPEVYDDPSIDRDHDGLPDGLEYLLGTDPDDADTDGDGYSDGFEHQAGSDPLDPTSIPGPVHGLDDARTFAIPAPDVPTTPLGRVPRWVWIGLAGLGVGAGAWAATRFVGRLRPRAG